MRPDIKFHLRDASTGAALMGRKVGDAVTIVTPGGQIHYEIIEIS